MERLESDLIAGVSSNGNGNGVKRNSSTAPQKNAATNVADRTDDTPDDTPEAETSQDGDDNVDSGAQSHQERSNGTPAKAASKVPGGVTEADNLSAPKPASFWLPHPEPEDMPQVNDRVLAFANCATSSQSVPANWLNNWKHMPVMAALAKQTSAAV